MRVANLNNGGLEQYEDEIDRDENDEEEETGSGSCDGDVIDVLDDEDEGGSSGEKNVLGYMPDIQLYTNSLRFVKIACNTITEEIVVCFMFRFWRKVYNTMNARSVVGRLLSPQGKEKVAAWPQMTCVATAFLTTPDSFTSDWIH